MHGCESRKQMNRFEFSRACKFRPSSFRFRPYSSSMPFRKVEARFAGPTALGILVPMGTKTLVVVRPRSLPWDFIPSIWDADSPAFPVFRREEAAVAARRFQQSLEASAASGQSPVETTCDSAETCFQIRLRAAEFVWLACRRAPGAAFQPIVFSNRHEAEEAATRIEAVMFPPAEVVQ